MKNIQYYHGTKEKGNFIGFTVAVDVPNKDKVKLDVYNLLGDNVKEVTLQVGVSILSPKDKYVKSVGREISLSRLQDINLKLDGIVVIEENKVVSLSNNFMRITLQLNPNREKVHLIEVEINSL